MTVGDREIDACTGSYILVPPGVVHTFANTSDEPVRFLNINSPGWLEEYLRDLARATRTGMMPGPLSLKGSSRSMILWSRNRTAPSGYFRLW